MLDTGFPRADAENDFLRARRHQFLAALTNRLRGRPVDSGRLVPLDEIVGSLGWRGPPPLGGPAAFRHRRSPSGIDSRCDRPAADRRLRDPGAHHGAAPHPDRQAASLLALTRLAATLTAWVSPRRSCLPKP